MIKVLSDVNISLAQLCEVVFLTEPGHYLNFSYKVNFHLPKKS
ncbi:hypothetical protein MuYL_1555 [Mucilaginibacter xinganensis]|uniref:Uncharacterized protein n=1 Tax=Mucilaginibacter xinganensis TaxID=1234841 RepID=A0A223NUA5_9SPHI|nr:hypothetical protein MuYL_1555 [Mucilaginibacter xinganensis]